MNYSNMLYVATINMIIASTPTQGMYKSDRRSHHHQNNLYQRSTIKKTNNKITSEQIKEFNCLTKQSRKNNTITAEQVLSFYNQINTNYY